MYRSWAWWLGCSPFVHVATDFTSPGGSCPQMFPFQQTSKLAPCNLNFVLVLSAWRSVTAVLLNASSDARSHHQTGKTAHVHAKQNTYRGETVVSIGKQCGLAMTDGFSSYPLLQNVERTESRKDIDILKDNVSFMACHH